MRKGIHPLLSPDLLRLLAEMGHDDALVLADSNFIAMRPGAGTPVLRLPGVGLVRALQPVTSLLPPAGDIPHPVAYMPGRRLPGPAPPRRGPGAPPTGRHQPAAAGRRHPAPGGLHAGRRHRAAVPLGAAAGSRRAAGPPDPPHPAS